jgi:hypothetical protein
MGLAARKKVEQEFSVDRLAFRKPRPLGRGQGELQKMMAETEKVYMSLLKAG